MIEIDVPLVRRLISDQFPQWAERPVRPVERSGWDNRTFRLGDDLSVRLPSAAGYGPAVEKEQRWLPYLGPRLPVPIPVPVGHGTPGAGYPYPWSVYRWAVDQDEATWVRARGWTLWNALITADDPGSRRVLDELLTPQR